MQFSTILVFLSLTYAVQAHVPEDDQLTKDYKALLRKAGHYLANIEAFARGNDEVRAWATSREARANVSAQLQSHGLLVELRDAIAAKKSSGSDVSFCEKILGESLDDVVSEARRRVIETVNRHTGMNLLGLDVLRREISRIKDDVTEDFRSRSESARLDVYRARLDDKHLTAVRLAGRTANFAPAALAHLKLQAKLEDRLREDVVKPVSECLSDDDDDGEAPMNDEGEDECADEW